MIVGGWITHQSTVPPILGLVRAGPAEAPKLGFAGRGGAVLRLFQFSSQSRRQIAAAESTFDRLLD
jgi:hypothetical protein